MAETSTFVYCGRDSDRSDSSNRSRAPEDGQMRFWKDGASGKYAFKRGREHSPEK